MRRTDCRLPNPAPNVLVIVIDTLCADHLGCYGFDRPTSPVLDSARTGTLFENCFATASWTEPSHASMLTGRLTHDHNADRLPMNDRLPTIAEAMRDRGYRAAAFSANTGYFSRRQGFGRGFLRFEDKFFSFNEALMRTVYGRIFDHFVQRHMIADQDVNLQKDAALVNRSYLHWLDADPRRPSFAFLNYMEVHDPYAAHEPFRSQFDPGYGKQIAPGDDADSSQEAVARQRNKYDACVADVDHAIGELLQSLDRRGLTRNTLVLITADHGEMFLEHGLVRHGQSLYFDVLHVPLIVRWPGHVPENVRLATPVSLASLPATVLGLVTGGIDPRFSEWSLSRLWQEPAIAAQWPHPVAELRQKPYFSASVPVHYGSLKALLTLRWYLILNSGRPAELYDRQQDPHCLRNLAGRKEFEAEYRALREELEKRSPGWT